MWHTDNRNAALRLDKNGQYPTFHPALRHEWGKVTRAQRNQRNRYTVHQLYHRHRESNLTRLSTGLDKQAVESPGMDIESIAKTLIDIVCL